jgi:hypothetical protein
VDCLFSRLRQGRIPARMPSPPGRGHRYSQPESIRGSVRKSADGYLTRVDALLRKNLGQRLVDRSDIRSVTEADCVPRSLLRGRGEEKKTELVGEGAQAADALRFVASCTTPRKTRRVGILVSDLRVTKMRRFIERILRGKLFSHRSVGGESRTTRGLLSNVPTFRLRGSTARS